MSTTLTAHASTTACCVRRCYTIPGTERGHAATRRHHAMCGAELGYVLLPGDDGCIAVTCDVRSQATRLPVTFYAPNILCPELARVLVSCKEVLCAFYALSIPCLVLSCLCIGMPRDFVFMNCNGVPSDVIAMQ
eukprot:2469211-Rhodomonas_salina.3